MSLIAGAGGTAAEPDVHETPALAALRPRLRRGPAGRQAVLRVGDLVAQRFEVVALVGHGGMGQIYRARDLELGGDVALKVLRPELSREPRAELLLRSEARLARKVTHRNVCRVFDVFHHQPSPGETPLLVLAMELLRGESLAARLRREPLALHEIRWIVTEVAAGMDAAHAAGVLHLDLKSSNVVLTDEENGGRVVITDFGLARALAEVSDPERAAAGTPSHMAPEQALGEVSVATDVFSLGALLHEMTVGGPLDRKALGGGATRSGRRLPRLWRRTMARATAPDPGSRFDSAGSLARALAPRGLRALSSSGGVAALVPLLVAASVLTPQTHEALDPRGFPAPEPRRSIALLDPTSVSAEVAAVAPAVFEVLASELEAGDRLRLLRPAELTDHWGIAAPAGAACGIACLRAVAEQSGASHAIGVGLSAAARGRVVLSLTSFDVAEQRTSTVETSGPMSDPRRAAALAGRRIRAEMGYVGPLQPDREAWRALLPTSVRALGLYAAGRRQLEQGDSAAAERSFVRVLALEPGHAMSHAGRADALSGLGRYRDASREYGTALNLGGRLPSRHLLLIQARAHEAEFGWDAAAAIYRSLATNFPENTGYAISLARAQRSGGRAAEALSTIEAARRGAGAAAASPALDAAEAGASLATARWPRALDASWRAIEALRARGVRTGLASALRVRGAALLETGRLEEARRSLGDALALTHEEGDVVGSAATLLALAHVDRISGDVARAERGYSEVVRLAAEAGYLVGEAAGRRGLAAIAMQKGHPDRAMAGHLEALRGFREAGEVRLEGLTLNSIALVQMATGDRLGAEQRFREALDLMQRVGNVTGEAAILGNLGLIRWNAGDLEVAADLMQRAFDLMSAVEDSLARAVAGDLVALRVERGQLDAAERTLKRAGAGSGALTAQQAWLRLAEGRLLLEKGDLPGADAAFLDARELFADTKNPRGEGRSLLWSAHAALERSQHEAARELAERGLQVCDAAADVECRDQVLAGLAEIAWARGDLAACEAALDELRPDPLFVASATRERLRALLVAEAGDFARAEDLLAEAIVQVEESGSVRQRFAAELAMASVLAKAGRTQEAVDRITALERESAGLAFQRWRIRASQAREQLAARARPESGAHPRVAAAGPQGSAAN